MSDGYAITLAPEEQQKVIQERSNADFQRTGQPDYDYQYLKMLADNQAHETRRQDNQNYFQGPAHGQDAPPMIAREGVYDPQHGPQAPHNSWENTDRYISSGARVHPTPGSHGAPLEVPYQYHPDTSQRVEDKLIGGFQNLLKLLSHHK